MSQALVCQSWQVAPQAHSAFARSLLDLIKLPDEELGRYDIALANLLCAKDLPGSEDLDIAAVLTTIDQWADIVRRETDRLSYRFRQNPADFHHSPGYFRMMAMITILQRDLGVRYNPARKNDVSEDFNKDSRDVFVHGITHGNGGTCPSLPVLYCAVGRRLGYPLKLVCIKSHLFARWDDPPDGERFNIEATNKGMSCYSDEHYLDWPLSSTREEAEAEGWLQSLTPREELADFIRVRGFCRLVHKRYREAANCFALAYSFCRPTKSHLDCIIAVVNRWSKELTARLPTTTPALTVYFPPRRYPLLPEPVEQQMIRWEVVESFLNDCKYQRDWWEPLRRDASVWQRHIPKEAIVHVTK